jgi:hypothetical protein
MKIKIFCTDKSISSLGRKLRIIYDNKQNFTKAIYCEGNLFNDEVITNLESLKNLYNAFNWSLIDNFDI